MALERFIGRYRVDRRLGEGGMGTVYLAHDEHIDRFVAIKLMRSDSEESLRRFKIEAKAAGRLKHPNIVTIYDFDIFDGSPCLVMEFVEGDTLARLIARNEPMTIARKLELIEHVCRALAFAHRAGIVHRDIKPHNLMIERDGTVKVLDFGIARTTAGSGTTGKIVGTVAYMAPEQALGRPVDSRTDIWAVGLVLYEFVTGQVAFAGDSDYSILDRIVRGEPEPFKHEDRNVIEELEPILKKALAKDPAHRYQNAEVMARDLSEARRNLADRSETPTIVIARPRPPRTSDPIGAVKVAPAPPPPVVATPPPVGVARPEMSPPIVAPPRVPEPVQGPKIKAPDVSPIVTRGNIGARARSSTWAGAFVLASIALVAGIWSIRTAPTAVDGVVTPPSAPSQTPPAPAPTPAQPTATQTRPDPIPPSTTPTPTPGPIAKRPAPQATPPIPTGQTDVTAVQPAPATKTPPNFVPRIAAAREAFENGDYAAALQRYEAVLRDDPGNIDATRGMQAVQTAQAAERTLLGLGAPPLTPQDEAKIKQRLAHARSRFEEGDYDAAISAYEEVLAIDPRNAAAQSGLRDTRSAKAAEEAILKRPPKKPGA